LKKKQKLLGQKDDEMNFFDSIQACLHGYLDEDTCNKIFLRTGMMAELDAVNLYETMAGSTSDKKIRKMLLDISKEEKTHVGEFQYLLKLRDEEYAQEQLAGAVEVEKMFGENGGYITQYKWCDGRKCGIQYTYINPKEKNTLYTLSKQTAMSFKYGKKNKYKIPFKTVGVRG